jgi:hypothetical protein
MDRNAKAARQGLDAHEKRILELETQVKTLINKHQTLINLVTQLQQTNALALQKVRGHGPT